LLLGAHHPPLSNDISRHPGEQQQTRCMLLQQANGTDRRTDKQMDRHCIITQTLLHKVKYMDIAVRSLTCHTATGTHMPYKITQCYLPPGRDDILAFNPAEAGTQLSNHRGMQG